MIYVFPVTVPAATPESAPIVQVLQLSAGTISLMMIQFPSGVNALAHITLSDGLHQLFPTNQDGDFATGAETIVWDEAEDLTQPPFQLIATAWNDDASYDHTLTLRIVMQPLQEVIDTSGEIAKLLSQGPPAQEGASTYPVVNP